MLNLKVDKNVETKKELIESVCAEIVSRVVDTLCKDEQQGKYFWKTSLFLPPLLPNAKAA